MGPDVVFDISRLATRFSRLTPNGIDRVDIAYARHFVAERPGQQSILLTPLGPRAVATEAAGGLVAAVEHHWRESASPEADPAFQALERRLLGGGEAAAPAAPGRWAHTLASLGRLGRASRWVGRGGLLQGRSAARHVAAGAVYLNVSQFPLWVAAYFKWLHRRPDVKPVFMIHDLLPLTYPEFFPKAEHDRFARRLQVLARIAAGAIVTSEESKVALDTHLAGLGRRSLPILVLPLPVAAAFHAPPVDDARLADHPYFVTCGTIEPRKNHLLLLQIWRELAAELGPATPRLVIVGSRGWDNENAVDLLERSQALAGHVVEVANLSTPGLKRLLDNACGLLMPSFAEGFGLPAAESLAAGVPAILSDIPAFRGFAGEMVTRLDPLDGLGWLAAIRERLTVHPPNIRARMVTPVAQSRDWAWHFGHVDDFLRGLQPVAGRA